MDKHELLKELEEKIRDEIKPSEWVVVRSSPSGVWCGRIDREKTDEARGVVTLFDAQRAYTWEGAFTCSGLAVYGPSGGKIAATVSRVVVRECCEVIDATPEAVARWQAVEEHKP